MKAHLASLRGRKGEGQVTTADANLSPAETHRRAFEGEKGKVIYQKVNYQTVSGCASHVQEVSVNAPSGPLEESRAAAPERHCKLMVYITKMGTRTANVY